jgi:hypothetical protein
MRFQSLSAILNQITENILFRNVFFFFKLKIKMKIY